MLLVLIVSLLQEELVLALVLLQHVIVAACMRYVTAQLFSCAVARTP